ISHPTDPNPPRLDLLVEFTGVSRRSARVFLHGVGRQGLMMKAFAMCLFHLGLSSHLVSDMTTPLISSPDLLIASAGPGGSPPSMRFAPSRNRAVLKLCSSPLSQREGKRSSSLSPPKSDWDERRR
ncbi:hypothetical protein DY000_02032966, partial [Brassica cretica]